LENFPALWPQRSGKNVSRRIEVVSGRSGDWRPLEGWQTQGKKVEYLGTEDVEGTAAHKLQVTRKNGDVSYVYLDPDYFLEIRVIDRRIEQGAQVEVETDLGDYEKVNDVYFPFSIEAGNKGASDKQKIIIDKAEANMPVEESTFEFPTKPAK